MSDANTPKTILEAIIMTLRNSPKKQATLEQIYSSVSDLLGKKVSDAIIRGTINRSLVTRTKAGPYPLLFARVAPGTYTLAKK